MIQRDLMLESLFSVDVRVMRDTGGGEARRLHPAEASIVAAARAVRRAEFAAGRFCAHEALDSLGAPDAPLLSRLDRAPLWPEGFVGSITHTAGATAAVVASRASASALGLDVEPLQILQEELRPMICRPEERKHHVALRAVGLDWTLLTFCAKEAFYKAYGPLTGRFLHFHDVSLSLDPDLDPNSGTFRARLTNTDLPLGAVIDGLRGRWRCDL